MMLITKKIRCISLLEVHQLNFFPSSINSIIHESITISLTTPFLTEFLRLRNLKWSKFNIEETMSKHPLGSQGVQVGALGCEQQYSSIEGISLFVFLRANLIVTNTNLPGLQEMSPSTAAC